ncbi:hypothetical protein KQX54_005022 [Cotesia glomerata]|uniref:Uncharacterized protein n=1 Tax=Cotesia glomerata TaxID=32391 RepID=A0AAV7I9U5_COTGL|nr:hypothetical protein KQX54_005022 [Cotesia glomerata]
MRATRPESRPETRMRMRGKNESHVVAATNQRIEQCRRGGRARENDEYAKLELVNYQCEGNFLFLARIFQTIVLVNPRRAKASPEKPPSTLQNSPFSSRIQNFCSLSYSVLSQKPWGRVTLRIRIRSCVRCSLELRFLGR